ncbi:heavy metal translocating P-type ATPase [Tuberibacillus sp. Marseille-P3662]|uniref:heavy metal translocating P-type ATPase n=1 Tax=Tuberibacillus sp. Marseille-P3662 TaxID=1965358 RepID=UPI000A1CE8E0|nr:heavy metal translocating P-type ATPase [Tuberibacillus sp. Marseille-P3662]
MEANLEQQTPKRNSFKPPSYFKKLQDHSELIAALAAGILIVTGWLVGQSDMLAWPVFALAYVVGGYYKAKEGIHETIKEKHLNVELLMIIAALGAALIGHWGEGAMLILIFAVSGTLESYTMDRTSKELSSLMSLQPQTARLITANSEQRVSIESVCIDDRIRIKPGERIPCDGVIEGGQTSVNEAAITGESAPITKQGNDSVLAGTINLDGMAVIRVTKTHSETLFSKILTLVQDAQEEQAPTQRFIDRFEKHYVNIVLIAVALMMVLPPFAIGWGWEETLYRAMILLVVASPCAVVASSTPAVLSAISYGARQGILFKGGYYLESMSHLKAVAFDKTGTLTAGEPKVETSIWASNANQLQVMAAVGAIEYQSTHPLATAITDFIVRETGIHDLPDVEWIRNVPGYGVEGKVGADTYKIGNADFMDESMVNQFVTAYQIDHGGEEITVFVEKNDQIVGYLGLKDHIRPEAKKAIERMHRLGIYTIMITGDNERTARTIAEEAGVSNYISGCLPDQKVDVIKDIQNQYGKTAMIGDGINDTPALATASIGIGMGSGTDAALETADIVLVKNKLEKVALSMSLARRLNKIVKQNLVFASSVIVLLILSNFVQFLDMTAGVIGHEGSTILVILNSLRMLRG